MLNYRAGIEATDSFLNASDVRASDIVNAVEEIAIGHRIVLLQDAAKLIVSKTPSGTDHNIVVSGTKAGVAHVPGSIGYPHWVEFLTGFGTAYRGDCVIGNQSSITALKLMSMTAGDNLTLGSWANFPGSNITDFNSMMSELGYGWIDGVTELSNTKLWVFNKATTLIFIQRRGMTQDEMERDAGTRTVRRWFGTQSRFMVMDTNGMKTISFA